MDRRLILILLVLVSGCASRPSMPSAPVEAASSPADLDETGPLDPAIRPLAREEEEAAR